MYCACDWYSLKPLNANVILALCRFQAFFYSFIKVLEHNSSKSIIQRINSGLKWSSSIVKPFHLENLIFCSNMESQKSKLCLHDTKKGFSCRFKIGRSNLIRNISDIDRHFIWTYSDLMRFELWTLYENIYRNYSFAQFG